MTFSFSMRPAFRALVSGLATGIFATTVHLWPLVFLSIVPLLSLLTEKNLSHKSMLVRGMLFWLGYTSIIFSWTFTWLGLLLQTSLPLGIALLMSLYSWLLTVGTPVIGYMLWALLHRNIWHKFPNRHVAALLSSVVFVMAELFGVFLFQFVFWGEGSTLVPHFSFAMIGYALGQSTLPLQYAWLGGVWSLSFVVIYGNIIISEFIARRERSFAFVIVVLCLLPCAMYLYRSQADVFPIMSVGVTHTNFNSNFEGDEDTLKDRYHTLNAELDTFMSAKPVLVVLPEGSGLAEFDASFGSSSQQTSFQTLLHAGTVIADHTTEHMEDIQRSRIRYWGTDPEVFSDKHVLLPQGEYVPYIQKFLQKFLNPGTLASLQNSRVYSPGGIATNVSLRGVVVAGRFCSESMSPFLYLYNAYTGAQLFINVASHSWFVESNLLAYRTQNIARVRAVESGRWFVQSGNKTWSFVIDNIGHVVFSTNEDIPRIVNVELRTDVTPYQWIANTILYALGL